MFGLVSVRSQPSRAGSPAASAAPGPEDVFDLHAHAHPRGLSPVDHPRLLNLVIDGDTGRLMRGSQAYRPVRRTIWDPAARIEDLDRAGVTRQVVSPVPACLAYDVEAAVARRYHRELNEGLAAFSRDSGSRVDGWAAVPLQDVAAAIAELEYAVRQLGLTGVEIGARVNGRELDDPGLLPFFAAAEALGVVVFIHPLDGGAGTLRRTGEPFDFGLGMLTDTALAACALVFGGVLERCPALRVLLAHGGGTFAWAWPRLLRGWGLVRNGRPSAEVASALSRIWVDSLTFDTPHLWLIERLLGSDHLVLGSDHPFIAGQLHCAADELRAASGPEASPAFAAALSANARGLLRLSPSARGESHRR